MKSIDNCPLCGSQNNYQILHRDGVPVHQNSVFENRTAALNIQRDDLTMCLCLNCDFVFNQTFNLNLLRYNQKYDNTQTYSEAFNHHIEAVTRDLLQLNQATDGQIVEVGCGKGHFLRRLVNEGTTNTGYGFDPTYEGPLVDLGGRLQFRQSFYDEQCATIPADIVLCRHVIEHVPDPIQLLKSIRSALVHSPKTHVFFETPCVEWILKNKVIWDFFYEHCSIFTKESLARAFTVSGFEVVSTKHVFGNQYLWLEAKPTDTTHKPIPPSTTLQILAKQYSKEEKSVREDWTKKMMQLANEGPVAIWGAGAKGATLAHLIDPTATIITCIVDVNPKKQGTFLGATGHPIVSHHQLEGLGIRKIVLMNPNYQTECQNLLDQISSDIQLLNYES